MLVELKIKNFAIIDNLSVVFGPGLNIFTGETGAGKSIIMDAIALVLGDRASNEIIRSEAEEAEVEAFFDVSGVDGLAEILKETGIDCSGELVIKRIVQRAGRNRIYINGSLATLVTLVSVAGRLIDIYGQSEHQSLTRPEEHIEVLDAFGGFSVLRKEMTEAYREYLSLKREQDSILRDGADIGERRNVLAFQSKEIADAALRPGEEEELDAARERLKNAEKIKAAALNSERTLYSEAGSVTERLGSAIRELTAVEAYDERIAGVVKLLASNLYQIEDAVSVLRGFETSVEFDAVGLEGIEERIDFIHKLKRKYNGGVEEILKKGAEIDEELSSLAELEKRVEGMGAALDAARQRAVVVAKKLSDKRRAAAKLLKKRMEKELGTLGMDGAVFEVLIKTEEDRGGEGGSKFGERGADRINFYISPNPGEEVKPLARIASGGELSRIMLALKNVTSAGRVPTLVFDEIDTGIGGAMTQVVGSKLKAVSRSQQVLCITHLPQIAAFADSHYSVKKQTSDDGRTVTSVKELKGDEPIGQIARMLGGANVTDTTRRHAMELMLAARSISEESDA